MQSIRLIPGNMSYIIQFRNDLPICSEISESIPVKCLVAMIHFICTPTLTLTLSLALTRNQTLALTLLYLDR